MLDLGEMSFDTIEDSELTELLEALEIPYDVSCPRSHADQGGICYVRFEVEQSGKTEMQTKYNTET